MIDISRLPHEPGCYLFRDAKDSIIYVGKAADLKKRVSSYFQKRELDSKTASLVANIKSVDYIITANEKEALILENNLIKKHAPKYNINLRDSKRYAYIRLTKEEFPRLVVARQRGVDGTYFGPFTSAEKRDALLHLANNTMKLRRCKRLPKKECLRSHMGSCSAPCTGRVSKEEYMQQVEDAKRLLYGRDDELLSDMRKRMHEAAKKQDYETAKTLRDQIASIEFLLDRQTMETTRKYDQDIINYVVSEGIVHLLVFNAQKGILTSKDEYEFDYREGFLEEFLLRYYSEREDIPKEIVIPEKVNGSLVEYLSGRRGSKVHITVPEGGVKKDLLELAKKNVEKRFLESALALEDLRARLGLDKKPSSIECFDVSHIQGSDPVGSMVSFRDGRPDKSNYRRFRIKTVGGTDDPAMIGEIVRRRYVRLLREKKELPDLIVVDGGRTQLSAAQDVLRELRVRVPVIGLAKRMEEIYLPGLTEPLSLNHKTRAIRLLQNIRDEAHRFAVKYHRLRRRKRTLGEK